MQVLIVIVVIIFLIAAAYIFLRSIRYHYPNPQYLPTKFLKSRWRSWNPNPNSIYGRVNSNAPASHRAFQERVTSYHPSVSTSEPTTEHLAGASAASNGIDRNTSIRSVMTLPAYNPTLNPSERLIAREGERAGIDTVIEFPETADDEEARREEDMESLYQIRQARRREIEEREERRRERQVAREAGDWARLEQLRLQSQLRTRARAESAASATSSTASLTPVPVAVSTTLINEHNARTNSREQRVSSVSYAELGLARHDGTRLRADSMESSSDQRPLLDSAASMGGHDGSRRNSSALSQPPLSHHRRATSTESFISADSADEGTAAITPRTSPRSGSDSHLPPALFLDTQPHPPEYDEIVADEEAPPYASPVINIAMESAVPAIRVTGTTPANSVPATPVDQQLPGRAVLRH